VLILENWRRRTEIVEYCVGVVDQSMDEKRKSIDTQEGDPKAQRKIQAELYSEEVKVCYKLCWSLNFWIH
jgi:hypothetical protein